MSRATLLVAIVLLISTVVSAQSEGYVAASNARGLVPENSFLVGDIDNVNLASGGVNLHIPLYTRTGRGISLAGYLNYGSKFWYQNPEFGLYGELDAMAWSQGPDFSFQLGSLGRLTEDDQEYDCTYNNQEYTETVYSAFIYRAADGSSYRFPNLRKETTLAGHYCQNTGLNVINQGASDSGGMMLDTTQHPYMLYHKDGSKECVDSNYYSCPVILTDSNGNTITEGTGGTVVDTMKRSFNPGLTPTMTQTVVDSNGNTQTFTWALQGTFSGTTQFPSTVEAGSVQVIQNTDFFQGTKTLTLPDQRQYVFSFDPNFGDLIRVDLPTGGYIRYQYVTLPAVDLIPSPTDGSCCLFALDSRRVSARFVSSTGLAQDEKEWQYSYNGNVTTVTDPLGNVSVHTFSTDDRFDPAYEVEAQYYQGSVTLLKTVVTTWGHDWGVVVQDNKAKTYGYANWRQMSVTTTLNDTNQVKEETYTYDSYTLNMPESLGNILTHSEYDWGTGSPGPLRRYTVYSYLNNNNSNYANKHIDDRVASKTIYDSTGNTCQGQSRPCAETTYGYDTTSIATKSGVVQHDYTDYPASMIYRGNLTTTSVWRNTDSAWLTATNYYNEVGNLTETSDPLSHPTYFDYSDSWSGTACTPSGGAASAFVTKTTNALNQIATAKYFPCSSLTASATDPNNQATSFAYDGLDRQTQDNFPDLGQTTDCYSDDSGGSCYSSSVPPYIVTTRTRDSSPSDNIISTTLVDGLGRVSQTQLNSDPEGVDYVDTTYDALGRKSIVSNPHRSVSNPTDGNTTYAYEALGRIQTVTEQDGSFVSTTYSGNCATLTDEAGKARKTCTDGLGRPSKVFEDPTGLNYETDYTYDALDNLTGVVEDGSRNRTFTYDSLGELTQATNPESGTVSYAYDNDGNLHTKTDARNITTTDSYDALNRLTSKTYSDGTPTVYYYYDQSAPWGTGLSNYVGRLTTEGTWSGNWITTAQFNYDSMGRVIGRWNCWGSAGSCSSEVSMSYDRAGDLTSETNPAGVQISYAYNGAPHVSSVTSSFVDSNHPATLWTKDSSEGYYPNGALRKAAFANGLTEANLYESRLQPCRMDVDSSGTLLSTCDDTLPSGNVQHLHYIFGGWGSTNNGDVTNLTAIGAQNFNRSYGYDSLNRISSMSAPGDPCSGLSWTIDPWGNRTDQTATGGTCNTFHQSVGTNNRFGSPYQYDAAGNMTYDSNHNYTYDAENRIVAVDGGSTASYVYNAEGERAQRTVSGVSTQYHYDSLGRVVAEYDGGCGPTCWNTGYVYINGQMKAEYKNSTTYFVHSDVLGSTRLLTGYPSPSIVDCDDYYPFGELISCGGTTTLTHKFTGKERNSETGGANGLDYFGARYNSSSLGRFMSPDPTPNGVALADPQSWNLYSYVRNNPTTAVDVGGKWWTYIHADITVAALDGYVSAGELKELVRTQYRMDQDQSAQDAYQHSMRAPGQSATGAEQQSQDFIANDVDLARDFRGSPLFATFLGEAIHTLQDRTSPMHRSPSGEPLPWGGCVWCPAGISHGLGEMVPSDSWAGIGQAIRLTMAAFMEADPERAAKEGLTRSTFEARAQERITRFVEQEFEEETAAGGIFNFANEEAARECALGNPAACFKPQ